MKIHQTPEGYAYVRDRALGEDVTTYLQQLNAIASGAEPSEVFDDSTAVHHLPLNEVLDLDEYVPPPPWDGLEEPETVELPQGVEVVDERDHRGQPVTVADYHRGDYPDDDAVVRTVWDDSLRQYLEGVERKLDPERFLAFLAVAEAGRVQNTHGDEVKVYHHPESRIERRSSA